MRYRLRFLAGSYIRETGVIHMVIHMGSLLDKAKVIHRLPSDYKLALVLGVDQKSLRNYRQGITMPDARVIAMICELTGDDAALLLAQIEEQRAKTEQARSLWHQVVERLQAGAATAVFAMVFGLAGLLGVPGESQARTALDSQLTKLHIVECARRGGFLFWLWVAPLVRYLRRFKIGSNHVSCAASIAAA